MKFLQMAKLPWLASSTPKINKETRKIRDSRLWRDRIRPTQLSMNPVCSICQEKGRLSEAVEVDHIVPLSDGGAPYDYDNLQSLCHRCHVIKTAEENRQRVKSK